MAERPNVQKKKARLDPIGAPGPVDGTSPNGKLKANKLRASYQPESSDVTH
jgi:hypothetical protein